MGQRGYVATIHQQTVAHILLIMMTSLCLAIECDLNHHLKESNGFLTIKNVGILQF